MDTININLLAFENLTTNANALLNLKVKPSLNL
jgi:hypothetical protein